MRIAIVNDMPMAVEALRRLIVSEPSHQIAWIARDGAEAVRQCAIDKPDLILMDLLMPVMDGLEATRRIMGSTPCAILVVTATVEGNMGKVYEALGAGALDAVNTPALAGPNRSVEAAALLYKISTISKLIQQEPLPAPSENFASAAPTPGALPKKLLAIGASAGGPAAVAEVLKSLPQNFPASIIVVQHVDAQFAPGLADWLHQQSRLPVRLAKEGDSPVAGTVLLAGTDDHLAFMGPQRLGYPPHPKNIAYRPSVDVFFESVVNHWRDEAVGVLLTGMGRDGAAGLKLMRDKGYHTIAQDKASCAVYGMPKAAAALNAAVEILPLYRIGAAVTSRLT